ncbi:DUF2165 domain-containing protein [Shewanella sp. 202IG2-18]|uniref:DUF2165 family protein n=1 Tax=Parashewanella hymeniacidonis TaxID=2807618 RepID=UPI001960C42E|nr:DUF2165 domain-containing protein [Parashewanella hymeniacidonis]MBM7070710.1 DUF2165 domain-containing protein [Parashewanella hymeniacidonis]
MMNYQLTVRLSKTFIALSIGLFCFIVGLDNILDFNTNYQFVIHVLSMDTFQPWFDGKAIEWRAITGESAHIFFYWVIIMFELTAGIICLIASVIMLKHIKNEKFKNGKALFIIGATVGIAVWYLGMAVIASEWFAMWANKMTSQQSAYNISLIILISMCYMSTNERAD